MIRQYCAGYIRDLGAETGTLTRDSNGIKKRQTQGHTDRKAVVRWGVCTLAELLLITQVMGNLSVFFMHSTE